LLHTLDQDGTLMIYRRAFIERGIQDLRAGPAFTSVRAPPSAVGSRLDMQDRPEMMAIDLS
jgi:hypothetical protein